MMDYLLYSESIQGETADGNTFREKNTREFSVFTMTEIFAQERKKTEEEHKYQAVSTGPDLMLSK